MDTAIAIVLKKPSQTTDYTRCLICQHGEDKGSLQQLSDKGYDSLLYAVDNRHDHIADRLLVDVHDKDTFLRTTPLYHGPCRNQYTNKKTVLQKLRKRQHSLSDELKECPDSSDELTPKRKRQSLDYKKVCFICEKIRNTKGHWKLTKIAAGDRQQKFHNHAKLRQDEEMLLKIQGHGDTCIDFVASDFRYHDSCMNKYMNSKVTSSATCTRRHTSETTELYQSAFKQIVSEIDGQLFHDRVVFYISRLCVRFRQLLVENGLEAGTKYRTSKLSHRFVAHYGERIQIVPGKGMSNLLCSSDITVGELFAKINSLKRTLEETELMSDSTGSSSDDEESSPSSESKRMSYHSAKQIRHDLKQKVRLNRQTLNTLKEEPTTIGTESEIDTETTQTRGNDDCVVDNEQAGQSVSGTPSDDMDSNDTQSSNVEFSYEAASKCIPDSLYNHVAWLVTDASPDVCDSGRVQVDQTTHEKILNLSQDIAAQVSKIPTPKQVGLSLHILKETRSKRTVTMLNRFGNAISYDDAQRYMTSMAQSVEEQTERVGFFVPANLKPGQFTHCY